MGRPYIVLGNVKIAPFKTPSVPPYGGFANTTAAGVYAVEQTVDLDGVLQTFYWPSSEHAYHAQKIIHLKRKLFSESAWQRMLTKLLRDIEKRKNQPGEEFLPREDYDPIINNFIAVTRGGFGRTKLAFDEGCDANYHCVKNPTGGINPRTQRPFVMEFMNTVLALKLAQHPDLAELAMDVAREGIIPVEVSRFDVNWASGPDGTGENMLGLLILEQGNALLKQASRAHEIKITDPFAEYERLRRTEAHNLKHDALVQHIMNPNLWQTSSPKAVATTSLNTWYDSRRNQFVVETHREANLQLLYKQGRVYNPSVLWRRDSASPWQDGDIQHPSAQRLLHLFQHATPPLQPVYPIIESRLPTQTRSITKHQLLNILQQLEENISKKHHHRVGWFTLGESGKINKLRDIAAWVRYNDPIDASAMKTLLTMTRDVCAIKRNPFGFFQPHSLTEFNTLVGSSNVEQLSVV